MRFVCLAPFVCLSLFVCFGHSACLRCFIVVMRFACVVHCVGRFVFAHRCRRFPLSHAVRLLLCGPPGLCISCVSSVFVRSVCFPSSVSQIIWFVKFSTRYTYFMKKIRGRQPLVRRISGQYSSLQAALLVLEIYYLANHFCLFHVYMLDTFLSGLYLTPGMCS